MPQPRFLGMVINRFSEGKKYAVTNLRTGQVFTLLADIQPNNFKQYNREVANFNIYNTISIYVVYNHKNPILEGNNTHAIIYNGKQYIVREKMECDRVGFMRYIAEAYTDPQNPVQNSIQDV